MNKFTILLLSLFSVSFSFSQQKQYKVAAFGFYNLENFYDTINQPNVDDDDFTPEGSYHYTGRIFLDKVDHLAEVISQIATDKTPDGLAFLDVRKLKIVRCWKHWSIIQN